MSRGKAGSTPRRVTVAAKRAGPRVPASEHVEKTEAAQVIGSSDRLAEVAARNTLAVNPIIGIRARDFGEGAEALLRSGIRRPVHAARHLGAYARALGRVLAGKAEATADPKDRRFADPAWQHSPIHRRLFQAHAATGNALAAYIDSTDLSSRDKARAQLVASIFIDTIAPSNTLLNPAALKRMIDSGGLSLVKGARNLAHDLRHNGGLPSSVDKSKFAFGKNLCLTPGSVVFRNEVLELIQYHCDPASQVFARPLVVCPPQVNKFYALDLSPEKSLAKYATENGVQMFAVSWRNPSKEQRDWSLSTYVAALDSAVDVARQVSSSPDVSLWGTCSGGMTVSAYLGWLAATGQQKVANVIAPVCVLDPTRAQDTTMGLFATEDSLKALKATVKRRGYVEGAEMARVFAWMRPNDLIWNYWVNNYLLGNDPPAYDVLYWNADTTRLPAAFHADMIDLITQSPYTNPDRLNILGQPIDMRKVDVEAFVVAGTTDHITPWRACYDTALIYGPKTEFVLTNAGHLQSMLNPPGTPKSFYLSAKSEVPDADTWAASAARTEGSWWPHWLAWMAQRSGERVPSPKRAGSRKHRVLCAAPGEYVRNK